MLCLASGLGKALYFGQYFVPGCWLWLCVALCYLPGWSRLAHVTRQCFNSGFANPALRQLLAYTCSTLNEAACCVTHLFPLSVFTLHVLLQA